MIIKMAAFPIITPAFQIYHLWVSVCVCIRVCVCVCVHDAIPGLLHFKPTGHWFTWFCTCSSSTDVTTQMGLIGQNEIKFKNVNKLNLIIAIHLYFYIFFQNLLTCLLLCFVLHGSALDGTASTLQCPVLISPGCLQQHMGPRAVVQRRYWAPLLIWEKWGSLHKLKPSDIHCKYSNSL